MDSSEFESLLTACHELAAFFPDGLVYIGGIAVYLHATSHPETAHLAETTHDADFYISLADMGDLRDLEEVTPNRRLSKHQLIKSGYEFDVYTERQSSLIVPYDAILVASEVLEGVRVASLEHLLVLKLEAFRDRQASSKGDKDAKDVLRIAAVAAQRPTPLRSERCTPYLDEEHMKLLERVRRGPYALSMARGNVVVAKQLRQALDRLTAGVFGVQSDGAD